MRGDGWRRLGGYGSRIGVPPAVFLLLLANLAVFVLQLLTIELGRIDPLGAWFSFIPHWAVRKLQIWRFVSYMFLHGDLRHLFFNMIGLFFFGRQMELYWGTRTFTWFYFACGIGGAVLHGAFSLTGLAAYSPMVGASGAIFGLLLAFGLAFPRAMIFVFMIIPLPAFLVVILFALLSIMSIGGANVAHLAHLGGMVAGFLFLWIFTGGRLSAVPQLPHKGRARGAYRSLNVEPQRRDAYREGRKPGVLDQLNRQFVRWRTRLRLKLLGGQANPRRGGGTDRSGGGNGGGAKRQDLRRVDEILEKISREGLKSLTPEEQDILRRASKRH